MDSQSEVHASENGDLSGLNEVRDDGVFSGIEGLDDLTEGSNFSTGIQSKANGDAPALKYSELMKLGSLENASTHSLFSVVNRILDESTERKNEDIPKRAVFAMKLVIQEIEQRVSKHAENMKKLNNLFKSREDKYQSRIKALETLATGNSEENKVVTDQFQQLKIKMTKMEERKKLKDQDLIKLRKENDNCQSKISSLKEELRLAKKDYEQNCFQLEAKTEETKDKLLKKILKLEKLLSGSANKVKEIQDYSESKILQWKRKEHGYEDFIDSQFGTVQELKSASESIKQEVSKMKNIYAEEFNYFGANLKGLIDAAREYHSVLEENRKLYNQVQDLKGNIRVYCRIRPFLAGQKEKQTIVKDIGEDGELVVQKPSKLGKDTSRPFKFNKVFGPAATQEEVFRDTQPLIRSVLDGYNVCIFAYGQTGSGKTYTMTGPNMASPVDWGVNYRALKDLFDISQNRRSSIAYEVGVQMVEIYNEQVRDLLSNGSLPKRLGIWNTTQPNGLVVPDASMYPVKSTKDVLDLMTIGLMNRSVSATSSNERSSRSHSILTVHVRGTDLKTNAILRGCLHLVDLAGSERVDRSEAIGDRLREAQHINKSLSALGDVIFALAQKSPHVPYRNSKLTQVLQSSLGGQAKTLMFVQLNPDVDSFSETISTLKFAERVSGVELGAARSNKEGRGVRELMEQVASLKDAVEKKDEEIGRLKPLKTNGNSERRGISSPRYGHPSPRRHSSVGPSRPGLRKSTSLKTTSDYSSEFSDKHSEGSLHQSTDDDIKNYKEFFRHSRIASVDGGVRFLENGLKLDLETDGDKKNVNNEDSELLGFGDDDSEERLSDISDSGLSMGTETDGSMNSIVEYTLFPETEKPSAEITEKPNVPVKIPRPPAKQGEAGSSRKSLSRNFSKPPSSKRATASSSTISTPSNRWL